MLCCILHQLYCWLITSLPGIASIFASTSFSPALWCWPTLDIQCVDSVYITTSESSNKHQGQFVSLPRILTMAFASHSVARISDQGAGQLLPTSLTDLDCTVGVITEIGRTVPEHDTPLQLLDRQMPTSTMPMDKMVRSLDTSCFLCWNKDDRIHCQM